MKWQPLLLLNLAPCVLAETVGKNTIATSDALTSLAFVLKYLPCAVAEDNGVGDEGHGAIQGRVQLIVADTGYTERNCQLHSAAGSASAASSHVAMTSNGVGKACSYSSDSSYGTADAMHKVFANNKVQCCNACVGTAGCAAATFTESDDDHSGGFGPQRWEGFGIHMPDSTGFPVEGGLTVGELDQKYIDRLGDHSAFDAFMDYSVTFFTYTLQPYIEQFEADGIAHFLGEWSGDGATWYSLIFKMPGSAYVIELVSKVQPSSASSLPQMEQRLSPAKLLEFAGESESPVYTMLLASVNRASSDLDTIDDVYVNRFGLTSTHELSDGSVTRHCFGAASQVGADLCFTSRASPAEKDDILSVEGHEANLWAIHAATMGSDPSVTDKMTDSHVECHGINVQPLALWFRSNDPFPITTSTRLAYACFQSYIIDPTGFSIQAGGPGQSAWSGCSGEMVV